MGSLFKPIFDYFNFSKAEKIAFSVLLLLLFLNALFFKFGSLLYPLKPTDFTKFNALINRFESQSALKNNSIELFLVDFDLNAVSVDQLVAFGCKPLIAQRIDNFRTKIGPFKSKSDIYKVYNIDSNWVKKVWNHIIVHNNYENRNQYTSFKPFKNQTFDAKKINQYNSSIEINSADTSLLKRLKGIGSVLAARIVSFRDKLGGFYSKEQLKEVYGLKEEVYNEFNSRIVLDSTIIVKININTIDEEALKKHPYFGYKFAKTVINYRIQHGKYEKLEDLLNTKLIGIEQIKKMKPYLIF